MSDTELVNGLRHMADDHPCCEATILHAIDKLQQLERENAALRAERDAARKLLDTHVLRSDLFGYLAWLEDYRDHGDIDLKRADYLILASDGTTCWGKTFMEAVQVAEQHDRELFDAARKEAQP